MLELSRVQALLEDVGAADEEIAAVYKIGEDEWAIVYDEATTVLLTFDDLQQKLTLSIQIGRPIPEREHAVFGALLMYSFLRQQTGGVHAALGGTEGDAVLLFDWSPGESTAADLAALTANFAEKGRIWREFVTAADSDTVPSAFHEFVMGMRV